MNVAKRLDPVNKAFLSFGIFCNLLQIKQLSFDIGSKNISRNYNLSEEA